MKFRLHIAIAATLALAGPGLAASPKPLANTDWAFYGGASGTMQDRYSTLAQINTGNVAQLKEAWRYDAGGAGQTQPMKVGNRLFGYGGTGANASAFAVDAASGKLLWTYVGASASRGFAYWKSGKEERLFVTEQPFVTALDPNTGKPIAGFGTNGRIDLRKGLLPGDPSRNLAITSPGQVFGDLYITGFRTTEANPSYPGDIRAYDVRTGKVVWTFHTIPHAGEPGIETWEDGKTTGAANNWTGLSIDQKRGIVYIPTGSATSDFYGANRVGDDLYANTLLALDARTGKKLWHFQAVHHDMWDRDFPSPPTLGTVMHDGKKVDIVAQPSKIGWLYVLDRVTGKPLWPIEERPVPQSTTPGEVSSKTQPFVTTPAPFARQVFTCDMVDTRTPEVKAWGDANCPALKSAGNFVPLEVGRQTVVFPGFDGGAEWGGSAITPGGVMYVNANDLVWTSAMRATPPPAAATGLAAAAASRGPAGGGTPPVDGADRELQPAALDPEAYGFTGYTKWMAPDGHPGVKPPWGTLNAIDLNTGKYLWTVPLGEYPDLVAKGITNTGSENYGGPVVTAGGLVFIGATRADNKFRAFDAKTGKILWEGMLPASGGATPITYSQGGKQYVVIRAGASYVAYALP
ncbi:MAG: glucose dehydrogenase [Caulobacteraceae bacterium]|nr:glucose dehydrogenase [Caulobacteraceae bacterium]